MKKLIYFILFILLITSTYAVKTNTSSFTIYSYQSTGAAIDTNTTNYKFSFGQGQISIDKFNSTSYFLELGLFYLLIPEDEPTDGWGVNPPIDEPEEEIEEHIIIRLGRIIMPSNPIVGFFIGLFLILFMLMYAYTKKDLVFSVSSLYITGLYIVIWFASLSSTNVFLNYGSKIMPSNAIIGAYIGLIAIVAILFLAFRYRNYYMYLSSVTLGIIITMIGLSINENLFIKYGRYIMPSAPVIGFLVGLFVALFSLLIIFRSKNLVYRISFAVVNGLLLLIWVSSRTENLFIKYGSKIMPSSPITGFFIILSALILMIVFLNKNKKPLPRSIVLTMLSFIILFFVDYKGKNLPLFIGSKIMPSNANIGLVIATLIYLFILYMILLRINKIQERKRRYKEWKSKQ